MTVKGRACAALRASLIAALDADRAALVDGTGRTSAFEDNLVRTLSEAQIATLRVQLAAGDGGELAWAGDGGRPDAHAAHSSAALAFNAFGAWLGFESSLVIDGVTGFTDPLRVEVQQRIFGGGRAPNLDCLLIGPTVVAGIESKLTEPLARHRAAGWSEAYGRASCRALLEDGWLEILEAARSGRYRPEYLDAAQLIKHALGLNKQHPDRERHLIYVYWEPVRGGDLEEVVTHREEVAELLDRVGNASPTLHALTYAALWEEWDRLTEVEWLPGHLAALRGRYTLTLPARERGVRERSRRRATPQLRDYYNALHALKEHEQTILAEAHAEDPKLLLHRFEQSLRAFGPPIDEPFYDTKRSDPADHLSQPDRITSTIEFAAQIHDGAPRPVDSSPSLAFRYVDRELSPLRSAGSHRYARRSLDLLLANANDGMPIYGELKIGGDKPAYFALVQLLALAADLLPKSQRKRLKRHAGGADLRWPEVGPYADLYIIALNPPTTGAYRARSLDAAREISEKLLKHERFSSQIRRIAYLEAEAKGDTLTFRSRYAYGDCV